MKAGGKGGRRPTNFGGVVCVILRLPFYTIPACDTHRQTNDDCCYPRIACDARVKTEWWGAGMFICQWRVVHWLTILINADRLTTWCCLQLEMSAAAVVICADCDASAAVSIVSAPRMLSLNWSGRLSIG